MNFFKEKIERESKEYKNDKEERVKVTQIKNDKEERERK